MGRIFRVVSLWAAAVSVGMGLAVYAQQPQTPSVVGPAVKGTSEEVLLDVVVRDKKGHRVDNLKPEDFQIFDNGEPKKITSFRLVQGGEAIGTSGTGSTRTQLDPLRQIRLVTMIFRCSDNNSRRLAHDAALDLLKGELPQNVYMAIMVIDFKLEVLQSFTNDTALLRQAIDRATRSDVTNFATDTEWVRRKLEEMLAPNANSGIPAATNPASRIMDQMLLETILKEQRNDMMQESRASIYALLDAVKEQYRLPGRKTVLYFSGGFVKPQELDYPFKQILSIANRSNVSFYTVDAHGLMTTSTNQAAIDMLNRAAQTAQSPGNEPGNAYHTRRGTVIDTGIESTRANPQTALEELAESTGGALIANTNDLQSATPQTR